MVVDLRKQQEAAAQTERLRLQNERASKEAAAQEEARRQEQELKCLAEDHARAAEVAAAKVSTATALLMEPAVTVEQKEAQVRAKAEVEHAVEQARRIASRRPETSRQARLVRQRHEDELRAVAAQEAAELEAQRLYTQQELEKTRAHAEDQKRRHELDLKRVEAEQERATQKAAAVVASRSSIDPTDEQDISSQSQAEVAMELARQESARLAGHSYQLMICMITCVGLLICDVLACLILK